MTEAPLRLSRLSALLSGAFAAFLFASAWAFSSQLAFAQAADSTVDFAAAWVLAWVVSVAQKPRDADHPMGHSRAEPLGALGVAMLAAVLSVQVMLSAFGALSGAPGVVPSMTLLWLFLAKVLFKSVIFSITRLSVSPALRALSVDARNDILLGLVSVVGFVGTRLGHLSWDAWLSFPVAVWIGWSGVELAKENIDLLMGSAPAPERQEAILRLAEQVPGVIGCHEVRAQHLGAKISVHLHVTVRADLTIKEGHDIGETVRQLIEQEADVADCAVHIDPD